MPSQRWADLYGWRVDRRRPQSLFRQIYVQVRSALLSGALAPGARLPSSRGMAARLGVARAGVVAAYEQLLAEGFLESRRGSGTFVSAELSPGLGGCRRGLAPGTAQSIPSSARAYAELARGASQTEMRPFNTGRTLLDARSMDAWSKLTQRAARSLAGHDLGYADPCGLIELRQSLCEYLRAVRAVRCDPGQILITAGTQLTRHRYPCAACPGG